MMKEKEMSKRIVILCSVFLFIFIISYSILLAEENIQQQKQKLVNYKQEGINTKIELKGSKNLEGGIEALNNSEYEKSAVFFEKYLLSDIENLDQLFGLSALSFGGFSFNLRKGVKYLESKIEKNSKDYQSFYYISIFHIMALSSEQKITNFLEISKPGINSSNLHYMLGLAYLLEGKERLYLKEVQFLKDKDDNLANRLSYIYDKSEIFKTYLKDIIRGKNLDNSFQK